MVKIKTNKYAKESEAIVRKAEKDNNWCMCIFFSVDIEGSTAYKSETRKKHNDIDWCDTFKTFYKNFPIQFLQQYSAIDDSTTIYKPLYPVLWKYVGDEILFYAPLTDPRQTLEHIRAFYQTITNYNDFLEKQKIKPRCKGTAWIAGFPVNNRIVLMPKSATSTNQKNNDSIDFVGISIDCGFRLTKFATSHKLVISLDLLWMIADSLLKEQNTLLKFIESKIKFAGYHDLKGVFSGKPYPVFWLSMFNDKTIENQWENNAAPCDCKSIVKFCNTIAKRTKPSDFIKPFIENNKTNNFKSIPKNFEQQRNIIKSYDKNEI
ncbi:MAG: hypothetical protein LBP59_10905 [Planctomycetaceae bacterium]|jgi:hypothetical protein|nr:hypothetical protein [Planctomycetaceae bacterium]